MDIKITGDKHGMFYGVEMLLYENLLKEGDILIICGDAGINYYGFFKDREVKRRLNNLSITFFCVHGNHEARPAELPDYELIDWNGGKVWRETDFPNLLFAKDGEIFNLNGLQTIVIGGAYSVDKYYRIANGYKWFEDEQPSEEIKAFVEEQLEKNNWKVDVVLSHTAPLKYEPTEKFIKGIDQNRVDKSTEKWLDFLEDRLSYDHWFCGHYHTDKEVDKIRFLYESIADFPKTVEAE